MNILIRRKKIKNLILKIEENGDILISAPLKFPESEIKKFLASKENWIANKRKSILEKYQQERFENGGTLLYLGKKYILKCTIGEKNSCFIQDGIFFITTKENTPSYIKKIVEEYVKKSLHSLILEKVELFSKKMDCSPEIIKIRKCKRIWGNCRTKTKALTFNLMLYKKDIKFIEYVVVHELAHLKYPHHQNTFWEFVASFLPDWKERKKL